MQSIGERIEEARKRKGISLREAAEATKIRSDFLSSIEQNKFDFDLPDIYKRGFLKNYARYLKIDPDKIIAEYNAQQLTKARSSKRGGSELFGSMEAKNDEDITNPAQSHADEDPAPLGRIKTRHRPGSADLHEEDEIDDESDKIFYLKAGALCLGVLALIIIIFGLAQAILGSDKPADLESESNRPVITDNSSPSGNGSLTERSQTVSPQDQQDTFNLIASGIVYVIVRQKDDSKEIYRGTLSEGETISLAKTGPADIVFTVAENLIIEHNGERLKPEGSGNAKVSLP